MRTAALAVPTIPLLTNHCFYPFPTKLQLLQIRTKITGMRKYYTLCTYEKKKEGELYIQLFCTHSRKLSFYFSCTSARKAFLVKKKNKIERQD